MIGLMFDVLLVRARATRIYVRVPRGTAVNFTFMTTAKQFI